MNESNILLYETDEGKINVDVILKDETIWLTQKSMSELFDVKVSAINKHLNNIYEEKELDKSSTISKMEIVRKEGNRNVNRELEFYNLDTIIAVGYRVNSKKATKFRIWAIKILKDYISLTDLTRYKNPDNPGDVVIKWMSNKSSFDFYSLWEELFNENFKLAESREFKNDSANNSFTMSPSRWINTTNAKGFVSKRGKYDGGTFAHPDIALEFASWIDPAFKLYLIQEFERLKYNETYQEKIEWSVRRSLSKTNYRIHTDSIKVGTKFSFF